MELEQGSGAFTDYFVVCSGTNPRQIQAIADEVEDRLEKKGMRPAHTEGYKQAEWVLLDYVDFVVHVFSEKARKFYDLELLGSLPFALEIVKLAGLLRKNVYHEVDVVEQHPLRLLVALSVCRTHSLLFQTVFDLIGNCLNLPRIGPAAHHKIVRKGAGALFQFHHRCLLYTSDAAD